MVQKRRAPSETSCCIEAQPERSSGMSKQVNPDVKVDKIGVPPPPTCVPVPVQHIMLVECMGWGVGRETPNGMFPLHGKKKKDL